MRHHNEVGSHLDEAAQALDGGGHTGGRPERRRPVVDVHDVRRVHRLGRAPVPRVQGAEEPGGAADGLGIGCALAGGIALVELADRRGGIVDVEHHRELRDTVAIGADEAQRFVHEFAVDIFEPTPCQAQAVAPYCKRVPLQRGQRRELGDDIARGKHEICAKHLAAVIEHERRIRWH